LKEDYQTIVPRDNVHPKNVEVPGPRESFLGISPRMPFCHFPKETRRNVHVEFPQGYYQRSLPIILPHGNPRGNHANNRKYPQGRFHMKNYLGKVPNLK
jgi:hypothetical protein